MLVNIPNTLTLVRIILVPLVVWLIITHQNLAAFVLFLMAGLSDAADGYLAKRYGWHTELGAYLDPIADKALLVSIYVTLGFAGHCGGEPRYPDRRGGVAVLDVVQADVAASDLGQQGEYVLADRTGGTGLGRTRPWSRARATRGRLCVDHWRAHHSLCRRLFLGVARAYGEL